LSPLIDLIGESIFTNLAKKTQTARPLFRFDDNHRNGHKDDDHANQLDIQ